MPLGLPLPSLPASSLPHSCSPAVYGALGGLVQDHGNISTVYTPHACEAAEGVPALTTVLWGPLQPWVPQPSTEQPVSGTGLPENSESASPHVHPTLTCSSTAHLCRPCPSPGASRLQGTGLAHTQLEIGCSPLLKPCIQNTRLLGAVATPVTQ